ncbi:hypothetical protein [Phenylobacterium sp.]|uniref:hypothetical protein n=1 Tax=Phenylobacterium sp. TaxID=1871053 RepID=UPI0035AE4CFA
MPTQRHLLALAFARGADILVLDADLTPADVEQFVWLARWLVRQGHLATFAVTGAPDRTDAVGAMGAIRARLGDLLVDANVAAGPPSDEPDPAFLAAVWDFDQVLDGVPASTAQFLGLDLEVIAPVSPDEEVGASVPGIPGLRRVYARPFCSGDFAHEAPPTSP